MYEEESAAESSRSQPSKNPSPPASGSQGGGSAGLRPVVALKEPPRRYGWWSSTVGETSKKPQMLIVFSGRSREGDLAHQMARLGWLVCSLDTVLPTPTDLTKDEVWDEIKKDLDAEFFQAGWIATPCGTFSPLREKPPGPRVIRTIDHITGIPDPTKAEAAQLRDSNILVHRSYKVAHKLHQQVRPWGLENPDHPPGKPSLWMMPRIEDMPRWQGVDITRFDQCITGLETTKPTKLYTEKLELSALKDKRCNHEKKVWTREDGTTFEAAHNPTVQRWEQVDGKMQRASKSQGEYTELLSKILAVAFHKNVDDKWKMEQLRKEML